MKAPLSVSCCLAALFAIAAPSFLPARAPAQYSTGILESVVRMEATSAIAEESSFPYRRLALRGRFTISRTGSTEQGLPVFVHYSGTAEPGVDYPYLPWLVTIPAGANSIDIEVAPTVDEAPEPIETVEATLSECPPLTDPPLGIPCYQVNIDPAHASARVFIRDDGITTASLAITAPEDGAEFGEGTRIPVAATAVDIEGAITHVEFFDGDGKIGESTIYFFRAPDPGTPIYHAFEWHGAPAGLHALTARAVNAAGNRVASAPVRISVADGVPVVSVAATVSETFEPLCPPDTCAAPEPPPGVFVISRRNGDLSQPLYVLLRSGGSALPWWDYTPLPNWVEIPAGQESVELFVTAVFDVWAEGDETVIYALLPDPSLGPIERYRIDPAQAVGRVVIHDRTPPVLPVVTMLAADPFAREGAGLNTASFVVRRAGATSDPLEVRFRIGGTASNGEDYDAITSPVTIPAGQCRARIVIRPMDDNLPERVETVLVTLLEDDAAVPGYVLGRPRRAAAMIVDNDHPRPTCGRMANGLFNVCMPMDSTQCFRVESTTDFTVWTPRCTLPVDEGMAHYIDPEAPDTPLQFYRVVPVACDPDEEAM